MSDWRIMITGPNRKRTAPSSSLREKGGTDKFGIFFSVVIFVMRVTLQCCDKVYNSDFISKVVLIKRTLILNIVSP